MSNFRSKKLLAYAKDAPHCMGCVVAKAEKKEFFRVADIRTREWLFETGRLKVA
jgi:hypothetical protein